MSIHFAADGDTSDTIYRIIFLSISSVSTEQWQLYAKSLRAIKINRGEPEILMGQSIVLGEVKAEAPLQNENP